MFVVYMHKAESKVYIGITEDISKRWSNGNGYRNNQPFYDTIQRIGWENIEHRIVADSLSYEEAIALEAQLIKYYKSTDPQFGYNRYKSATEYRPHTSDEIDYIRSKNPKAKIVQKINEQGQVITEYASISVAAREIRGTQQSLSACLNGRMKSYKGFQWRIKEK